MGLERDQRWMMSIRFGFVIFEPACQCASSAGGVDYHRRVNLANPIARLQPHAAHAALSKLSSSPKFFAYVDTRFSGANQQSVIHLGPAQTERGVTSPKPLAGHTDTLPLGE